MVDVPVLIRIEPETYDMLTSVVFNPYILIGVAVLVFFVVIVILKILERREKNKKSARELEMRAIRPKPPSKQPPKREPQPELRPEEKLIKRESELKQKEEEFKRRKKIELSAREGKLKEKEDDSLLEDSEVGEHDKSEPPMAKKDQDIDLRKNEPPMTETDQNIDDTLSEEEDTVQLEYKRNRLWKLMKTAENRYLNKEIDTEEFKSLTKQYQEELIDIDIRLRNQ